MIVTLDEAIQRLLMGEIVALPTETVYGLAASIKHPQAIEQIFARKGRPANNPLIIHLSDFREIAEFVRELPPDFEKLAQTFWPGPLTVVLPLKDLFCVPERVRAGLPTAAFRIPNQKQTLEILRKAGPLVMPSANRSGKPSSTHPAHIAEDFGVDFPVLDGGSCSLGLESTILYYQHEGLQHEGWRIIREGSLSSEKFFPILGYRPLIEGPSKKENPICPGQYYRHYAPKAKLYLLSDQFPDHSLIIGFEDREYPVNSKVLSLGPFSKPETVAANLYKVLRQLDEIGIKEAYVDVNFVPEGLYATIAERLHKASDSVDTEWTRKIKK
jgi:L-threonylcarbamoyladenylate synthase